MAVSKSLRALLFGKPAPAITINVHCTESALSPVELAREITRRVTDDLARNSLR